MQPRAHKGKPWGYCVRMEPSAVNALEDHIADVADAPEVTEVLVEEISIDGMCGVY